MSDLGSDDKGHSDLRSDEGVDERQSRVPNSDNLEDANSDIDDNDEEPAETLTSGTKHVCLFRILMKSLDNLKGAGR